jgi:hypothetical protein
MFPIVEVDLQWIGDVGDKLHTFAEMISFVLVTAWIFSSSS